MAMLPEEMYEELGFDEAEGAAEGFEEEEGFEEMEAAVSVAGNLSLPSSGVDDGPGGAGRSPLVRGKPWAVWRIRRRSSGAS